MTETHPPLRPFTRKTATQKVQADHHHALVRLNGRHRTRVSHSVGNMADQPCLGGRMLPADWPQTLTTPPLT
jgi:hypothetical protein